MIILKLCWLLMIFSSPGFAWNQEQASKDRYGQPKSFNEVALMPLPNICEDWSLYRDPEQDHNQKQAGREQRDTFDNVQSKAKPKVSQESKEDIELQRAADVWYRNLMKNRGNQKRSGSSKEENPYALAKIMDRSEKGGNAEPKLTEWSKRATVQKPKYTKESSKLTEWRNEVKVQKPKYTGESSKLTEWRNEAKIQEPKYTEESSKLTEWRNEGTVQKPKYTEESSKLTEWRNEAKIQKPRYTEKSSKLTEWRNVANVQEPKYTEESSKLTEWRNEAKVQNPKYSEEHSLPKNIKIPDVDMKLKHLNKILHEQNNLEDKNRADMKKDKGLDDYLSDFDGIPMPDGVYEHTLNSLGSRLYHHTKAPQLKDYKYPKHLSSSARDMYINKQKRRSMDPLEEIKLKTSMKMMDKGFGPVLPSSTYEAKQKNLKKMEALRAKNNMQNFDSKRNRLNSGQIMQIPNRYDKEITKYDPVSVSYQSDTAMTTYIDPESSPIGALDQSSLGTFGKPPLDFELYAGLSGVKEVGVGSLTNLQGVQYDTMLKTSHVENDYAKPSEKMEEYPASYLKSYPYAVAKLMADDLHYKNREKRRDLADKGNRRRKRSLDENIDYNVYEGPSDYSKLLDTYDNDSLAHVYDPTKIEVPLMKQRPKIICLQPPEQILPEVSQQQFREEVNQQQLQKPVEHFKASFNLSDFMNDLHKMRSAQKPKVVPQPVRPQQALAVPVKQPVTEKPTLKTTLAPVKSAGIRRFFGHFFNKQTTMNPDCVSITMAPDNSTDNSTTSDLGTTSSPGGSPGGSPDGSPGGSPEGSPGGSPGESAASPNNTSKPTDNVCSSPDAMKLNLSINAQVCGNPKTKQFHSNGSISLQPPNPETVPAYGDPLNPNYAGLNEEEDVPMVTKYSKDNDDINLELKTGEKQGLVEDFVKIPMKSIEINRGNGKHITSQNVAPKKGRKTETEWTPPSSGSKIYDMLITGELSKDILGMVIDYIDRDPELTKLVPVLKQNNKDTEKKAKSTKNYPFWDDKAKQYQGSQVCYPLPPDLQDFYDQILCTAEQVKIHKKSLDEFRQNRVSSEISPRYMKLKETAEYLKESRER